MGKEEGPMSVREADRAAVIEDVVKKRLCQREAAERLGIGVRQIKRLSRRYRERGAAGLVSGHRGKRPNNAIDAGVRREVVDLVRERYRDFGPACAREAGGGARSSAVGGDAAPVDDRGWPAAREGAAGDAGAPESAASIDDRIQALAVLAGRVMCRWKARLSFGSTLLRAPTSRATRRSRDCAGSATAGTSVRTACRW